MYDMFYMILIILGKDENMSLTNIPFMRAVSTEWRDALRVNTDAMGLRLVEAEGRTMRTSLDLSIAHRIGALWRCKACGKKMLDTLGDVFGAPTPTLHTIDLAICTELTTVDALAAAPALHTLNFTDCDGLANVDALVAAQALRTLDPLRGAHNRRRTREALV
jgi:hypothetical protein